MVEVPTKNPETAEADVINAKFASGLESIKNELGEIMKKMKIQPSMATVIPMGKAAQPQKRVALAVAKA